MYPKMAVMLVVFLLYISAVLASDPDPLQDYCIPNTEPYPICKNSSLVTVDDFVFSGIKYPARQVGKNDLAVIPVNPSVFPGLNTLGMSFVRFDFGPGGVNAPHSHPRASETAFVLAGKVYLGFVDSSNRVFAKVLEKGEVMVFPRGSLHFMMNVGNSAATVLGSLDSQNPGLVFVPSAVFGSGIEEKLLEKAFGLSSKVIGRLRQKFGPPS